MNELNHHCSDQGYTPTEIYYNNDYNQFSQPMPNNNCHTAHSLQVINPAPNNFNPVLFDYEASNSTGSLKLHQNSTLKFVGVGVEVTTSQSVANQEETNTVTIKALGGGTGVPYTGSGFTTVTGSDINTDLSTAAMGATLPANKGFLANDNKYYTSIPSSMITGLVAPTTETPNGTLVSPTVTVTLSGTANRNIKADAIISANAGNQLSNSNGLFVPTFIETNYTASQGVKKIGNNFSLDTTTILANSIPTSTLNNFPASILAGINGGNNPTNGTYQITVAGGNASLTTPVLGGGSNTPLTANDSNSLDFTTSGTDNHTLTGNVKISAQANNSVSIVNDGLFVSPAPTPINYTASQGVSLVGNNFQLNPTTIPANSIPASAILGLPSLSETTLTAIDSTSIDFSVSGIANHTITGAVKISPDSGNLLTNAANGSGLYVSGATSGGTVSTLTGDVTGTSAATTVAKIRGTNVSNTAPTIGQSLIFNGTDYVPTTAAASISTVTVANAPSTIAANLSKFQVDSVTGKQFFVDSAGVTNPLSPCFSKTIGFDVGTATDGSIAPSFVGFDIIRVASDFTKVVLETVDFVVKNDFVDTITGSIILEIQDDTGATICTSGSITYPAVGSSTVTSVAVPVANRVRANPSRYTAKVISGGDVNLGVIAEISGFAGK